MLNILLSVNPSVAFLWAVLLEAFYYMRISELDRAFDSIIRDVEEELEEEMSGEDGISVAFVDDTAYWVLDNTFYQADIIDGVVDKESSRPVDVFNMPLGEMDKMLFILDHLNEG